MLSSRGTSSTFVAAKSWAGSQVYTGGVLAKAARTRWSAALAGRPPAPARPRTSGRTTCSRRRASNAFTVDRAWRPAADPARQAERRLVPRAGDVGLAVAGDIPLQPLGLPDDGRAQQRRATGDHRRGGPTPVIRSGLAAGGVTTGGVTTGGTYGGGSVSYSRSSIAQPAPGGAEPPVPAT